MIPAHLRRRFGLDEGSLVLFEEGPDGVLIKPAAALPLESYTPERQAAFLLEIATDEEYYERARETVRSMGIDPDRVAHERPG